MSWYSALLGDSFALAKKNIVNYPSSGFLDRSVSQDLRLLRVKSFSMIEQPQLGNRIKELRERKGLTQKDLAFECNISERTLQRIENGHVNPRKYTVKVISDILEEDLNQPIIDIPNHIKPKRIISKKIITAFTITTLTALVFLYFSDFVGRQNSHDDVELIIKEKNQNFIQLINKGEIDAVTDFYSDDACLVTQGCGKDFIKSYYIEFTKNYRFTDLKILNVSVGDTIAVEKGKWIAKSSTGEKFEGEYIAEWKLRGNIWLIVNEIPGLSH